MDIFLSHYHLKKKISIYLQSKNLLFVCSHGNLDIIFRDRGVRRKREMSQLKQMWENLTRFLNNTSCIWTIQMIIDVQVEKNPQSSCSTENYIKDRKAKMHADATSQRRKSSFQLEVQGEDTMPEPWNLELCHCQFSVWEGNMILCCCSYLLQTLSGIWYWSPAWWVAALNFPTDQCRCGCCMKE